MQNNAKDQGEHRFVNLDRVYGKREFGVFVDQSHFLVLLKGAAAFWKFDCQWKTSLRNQRQRAHLPRLSRKVGHVICADAYIAPATSGHKAPDPSQGQTQCQARSKYVQEVA